MSKVALADDNMDILESTQMLLEALGYEVVTTNQAEKIVPMLEEHRPVVLLQDVNMPRLDVREHIRTIRSNPDVQSTPVVLFTASVLDTGLPGRVGADGILFKPFEADKLQETVEKFASRSWPAADD